MIVIKKPDAVTRSEQQYNYVQELIERYDRGEEMPDRERRFAKLLIRALNDEPKIDYHPQ